MTDIPNPEQLAQVLLDPNGPDRLLISDGDTAFYVGLNSVGDVVRLEI